MFTHQMQICKIIHVKDFFAKKPMQQINKKLLPGNPTGREKNLRDTWEVRSRVTRDCKAYC